MTEVLNPPADADRMRGLLERQKSLEAAIKNGAEAERKAARSALGFVQSELVALAQTLGPLTPATGSIAASEPAADAPQSAPQSVEAPAPAVAQIVDASTIAPDVESARAAALAIMNRVAATATKNVAASDATESIAPRKPNNGAASRPATKNVARPASAHGPIARMPKTAPHDPDARQVLTPEKRERLAGMLEASIIKTAGIDAECAPLRAALAAIRAGSNPRKTWLRAYIDRYAPQTAPA